MQVKVHRDSELAVISVAGEVDLYSSPEMRKAITGVTRKKVPVVVVDLEQVEYMDSSGVATLVEGLQLSNGYGGSFRLAGLRPEVREVFELSRLDRVFRIYDSADQAARTGPDQG